MTLVVLAVFSEVLLPCVDAECKPSPSPHLSFLSCKNEYNSTHFYRRIWGLTEVPGDIPAEALKVDLMGNNITSLPSRVFAHLSQCTHLYLRDNQISSIEENAFSGLESLERLNLLYNRISVVRTKMFTGLSNLRSLFLSNNIISSIEQHAFQGLESLQNLYLIDNRISILPARIFIRLRNLTELRLDDNNISSIEEQAFHGLESLKKLFLWQNKISVLHTRMFMELKTLEWLNLIGNQIVSIDTEAFSGLTSLQRLNLGKNKIAVLQSGLLAGLKNLRVLSLDQNQIASIDTEAFSELVSLLSLSLKENKITVLQRGLFSGLRNLVHLHLEENSISSIDKHTFGQLGSVSTQNMDHNNVPVVYSGLSNLRYLRLWDNQISHIEEGTFDSMYKISVLSLSNNRLTTLRPDVFRNLPRPFTFHPGSPRTPPHVWNCSSLCWLKHEEQHKTVSFELYIGAADPWKCLEGKEWKAFDCGDAGRSALFTHNDDSKFAHKKLSQQNKKSLPTAFFPNCWLTSVQLTKLVSGICPEPGGVPFSTRTKYNRPYNPGDQVTYTCLQGGGAGTITCQGNGNWTTKPTCTGYILLCFAVCYNDTSWKMVSSLLPNFGSLLVLCLEL